jgi:hypothetical protein
MTEIPSIPAGIRRLALFLLFITQAFTNLVLHAGSTIVVRLTLMGIYVFYKFGPASFSKWGKAVNRIRSPPPSPLILKVMKILVRPS